MDQRTRDKILGICEEFDRLTRAMSTQEVASDPDVYRTHAKRQAELGDIVACFRRHEDARASMEEAEAVLRDEADEEYRALAEEERNTLREMIEALDEEMRVLLVPKDPNDDKNTIVEIRAGTGGDEAGLFVADLYRMYTRYAEAKGWKVELLSANETELGGFKEISFQVTGDHVYSHMKWEGGVHRVQRVPETETQGRVHTSAVTVAVLPEAEEVDVVIDANDLQIDVYRSSGPGGQSVNTTDSAVRITHKPTGITVSMQDEKSQHKNKAKALKVLRSRVLARKEEEENASRSEERRTQVGSGDRSERIRTYNFPQNRLSDHRINLTLYNLDHVMEGELQSVVDALITADRAAKLSAAS